MVRCGTARRASTASRSWRGATSPSLRQVGLPGDPDDTHSRYIEAEVDGLVVASIYLPNGNPIGTEKFDYKLRWMERLGAHARGAACRGAADGARRRLQRHPRGPRRLLAPGDGNDALFQPESQRRVAPDPQPGLDRCPARASTPTSEALHLLGLYRRRWPRDAGFRIDHLLCSPEAADRLHGAGVHKWARGEEKASDHAPSGSSSS